MTKTNTNVKPIAFKNSLMVERSVGQITWYKFAQSNRKGEMVEFSISKCTGCGGINDLPHLWYKAGYTDHILETYLSAQTYVTEPDGTCYGRYNPTIKPEIKRDSKGRVTLNHMILDFNWVLEDTEENRQKIINEICKLANA